MILYLMLSAPIEFLSLEWAPEKCGIADPRSSGLSSTFVSELANYPKGWLDVCCLKGWIDFATRSDYE